jgi:hypothetical protein
VVSQSAHSAAPFSASVRNGTKQRALIARLLRFRAAVMVQDTSVSVQEAFLEAIRPTRPFSVTRVIGGKLRVLYDETAESSVDLDALLSALSRRGGLERGRADRQVSGSIGRGGTRSAYWY